MYATSVICSLLKLYWLNCFWRKFLCFQRMWEVPKCCKNNSKVLEASGVKTLPNPILKDVSEAKNQTGSWNFSGLKQNKENWKKIHFPVFQRSRLWLRFFSQIWFLLLERHYFNNRSFLGIMQGSLHSTALTYSGFNFRFSTNFLIWLWHNSFNLTQAFTTERASLPLV